MREIQKVQNESKLKNSQPSRVSEDGLTLIIDYHFDQHHTLNITRNFNRSCSSSCTLRRVEIVADVLRIQKLLQSVDAFFDDFHVGCK